MANIVKLKKANRIINVDETLANGYLLRGYDQIDEKGKVVKHATGGKAVSIAEHNNLREQHGELKVQHHTLAEEHAALKEKVVELTAERDELLEKAKEFAEKGKALQEENSKLKAQLKK